MDVEKLRDFCRSLPHVAENVQWGNDLVFKVGDKMFAVVCLDQTSPVKASFKCTPEEFDELLERDGVVPAPYLARAKWVGLERLDAIKAAELKRLLRGSYDLVYAKLPKKVRTSLESAG